MLLYLSHLMLAGRTVAVLPCGLGQHLPDSLQGIKRFHWGWLLATVWCRAAVAPPVSLIPGQAMMQPEKRPLISWNKGNVLSMKALFAPHVIRVTFSISQGDATHLTGLPDCALKMASGPFCISTPQMWKLFAAGNVCLILSHVCRNKGVKLCF